MSRSSEIVELKVISRLCRLGVIVYDFLDPEEKRYAERLMRLGLAVLRGGRVKPASEKLCQLYEQYLACYNNISKKCEWPYGRIHECWMEEWARCLSLLP